MYLHLNQRKPLLIICCFLFSALAGLLSCQKDLSYEVDGAAGSSGSKALFSLVPSGNNCSDATIAGIFQAGTLLMADSKLIVTVNVTKEGAWNYTTGAVNGFVFIGTGNFLTTGSQIITLQASGTPLTAGNSSFTLAMGATTCSVNVAVVPSGSGGSTGTSDIYYIATIGGVNYTQSVTATNGYEAGSGMDGTDDVSFGGGINYSNPPVPTGNTEMGVGKGLMHHYLAASNGDFKAFFAPGDYLYAPSATSFTPGDGIVINWTDPAGEYWNTRNGSVDQSGSTFKIISTTDAYDALGNYYIKVKMQFNCKLYNVTTGTMKQLTNGEIVALFGKM